MPLFEPLGPLPPLPWRGAPPCAVVLEEAGRLATAPELDEDEAALARDPLAAAALFAPARAASKKLDPVRTGPEEERPAFTGIGPGRARVPAALPAPPPPPPARFIEDIYWDGARMRAIGWTRRGYGEY
jgi:hypothetical protein